MIGRLAALALCAVAVAGCGRAAGVDDTRRALAGAGYSEVDIELHAARGVGVARVVTASGGPPADTAAGVVWKTLPVRFDQLVVASGDDSTPFSYEDLTRRFGSRDPSLDGKQVDEEVVERGVKLMLLLSAGALLSVGAVVVIALRVLRAARAARSGSG